MINIKPLIYQELSKLTANVTDTYPDDWETFPVVIFLEEQNKPFDYYDDKEQKSEIRYKIDVFDKASTSDLSVKINEVFAKLGLKRLDATDVPEPNHLKHKVMRFEGIVDINTEQVYHRRTGEH